MEEFQIYLRSSRLGDGSFDWCFRFSNGLFFSCKIMLRLVLFLIFGGMCDKSEVPSFESK